MRQQQGFPFLFGEDSRSPKLIQPVPKKTHDNSPVLETNSRTITKLSITYRFL